MPTQYFFLFNIHLSIHTFKSKLVNTPYKLSSAPTTRRTLHRSSNTMLYFVLVFEEHLLYISRCLFAFGRVWTDCGINSLPFSRNRRSARFSVGPVGLICGQIGAVCISLRIPLGPNKNSWIEVSATKSFPKLLYVTSFNFGIKKCAIPRSTFWLVLFPFVCLVLASSGCFRFY